MDGLRPIWITFIALALLSACIPQENKTSCASNERINGTTRKCEPITVAVPNGNKAPIGIDQNVLTDEGVLVNFTLNMAIDHDNDLVTYSLASAPAHGSLTECMDRPGSAGPTDRTCRYIPTANWNGTDSFTYRVHDGYQYGDQVVTVTIIIAPVEDAPVLIPLSVIATEDQTYSYQITSSNYYSPDNNRPDSCLLTNPVNVTTGACSCIFGICNATFTPDANLNSTTSTFSFDVVLTSGAVSSTTTQTVSVMQHNDPPSITTLATCVTILNQDSALNCTAPVATDVDTADLPPQTLSWSLQTGTGKCNWASINPTTGAITGTPTNEHVGGCDLVYQVSDGTLSDSKTIAITVLNSSPALSTVAALNIPVEDGGRQFLGKISSHPGCTEAFCLSGDTFASNDLDLDLSDCPAGLSLESTADSQVFDIYYTPAPNVARQNSFCHVVVRFTDTHETISAFQSITIQEINDAPFVTDIPAQVTNEATLLVVDTNLATKALDPIILDEGGGDDEVGQTLTVRVASSNTTLLPHSNTNIKMYGDSDFSDSYAYISANATGVTYTPTNGNQQPLYLVLTPVAGRSGTTTLTVTVTDDGTSNGASDPQPTTKTFTLDVSNGAAGHDDWTELYATGARILSDGAVDEMPEIRLGWNQFKNFNDTVVGYHVFRSENEAGPFITPLNETPITELTYTDSSLTESDAGKVYYYRVKGVSANNGQMMDTSSNYSTQRMIVPPHNMALVSRRMANKEACSNMGKTSDKFNDNRCTYIGPGSVMQSGTEYWNIQNDYFVDRYEASCNYTQNSSSCLETGEGCIGNGTPVTGAPTPSQVLVTTPQQAIYYNRANGKCYFYTGSWTEVANLTSAQLRSFASINQRTQGLTDELIHSTFPKRPPLVHVQQFKAYNYCTATTINPSFGATNKTLMNRQISVAAAAWPSTQTDPGTIEAGETLSASISQCNSSEAADIEFSNVLAGAIQDAWTGTADTNSPRFVMAGSTVTQECKSRYGIQDLVGNVEEWNIDRWFIHDFAAIYAHIPVGDYSSTVSAYNTSSVALSGAPSYLYNRNGIPVQYHYFLTNSLPFTNFRFDEGASSFLTLTFPALGFPSSDGTFAFPLGSPPSYDDTINLNSDYAGTGTPGNFTVQNTELSATTSGGSYKSSVEAGRYHLKFRSICHDANNDGVCAAPDTVFKVGGGDERNIETGFRCMLAIP